MATAYSYASLSQSEEMRLALFMDEVSAVMVDCPNVLRHFWIPSTASDGEKANSRCHRSLSAWAMSSALVPRSSTCGTRSS